MYCKFDKKNRLIDFSEKLIDTGMYAINGMPDSFFEQSQIELKNYQMIDNKIVYCPEAEDSPVAYINNINLHQKQE